jgi:phosphoserine phosphatase
VKYKLIIFDMDGVLFKYENFWMKLHESLGTLKEGKILTEQYLHTDYDRLVAEVVAKLWLGKDAKKYYELVDSYNYLQGVKETLDYVHSKKYLTAIVSGSSMDVAKRVQKDYGIDFLYANELIIKDGKISGEFRWAVGAGKENKARIIQELCKKLSISPYECIYIGDSNFDIEAFKEVGKSIAFNSSSKELKAIATHIVDSDNLSDVIKYLE